MLISVAANSAILIQENMAEPSSSTQSRLQTVSVVIIGNFNPVIFQPKWFSANAIISESDADSAQIEVVHSQLTSFSLGWLLLRVESGRFVAEVNQPPYIGLQDFVLKTFRDALSHTPCRQVGLNLRTRVSMATYEQRDKIGRTIAPIEPWCKWGELMDHVPPDDPDHGGVLSQRMRIPRLAEQGELNGRIEVTIEPTQDVLRGISVLVNSHFEIGEDSGDVAGAEPIMGAIERNFDAAISTGDEITSHIISLGDN